MTEDNARPLGDWLRQRREELDISLDQVEADTRIRLRYLAALEAEDFEALPDPAVGRGFLRNYAGYLDLDPVEAVNRFAVLVTPPEPEPVPGDVPSSFTKESFRPVPLHHMPTAGRQRGFLVGLFIVLATALAALAWWGYPRVAALLVHDRLTARPTATQLATGAGLSTATHTPTQRPTVTLTPSGTEPTASETATVDLTPTSTTTPTFTPSPPPSPSPTIYTGIFLELVFTDTSWVQITTDGIRQFQGELETDTYRSWYADERLELRIGNGGAVIVTLNGQRLGALGEPGEVIDRVFEKIGEELSETVPTLTPTPEVTETPTATTIPTIQPLTATATLSPTIPITATSSP